MNADVDVRHGDCVAGMAELEAESVDAIVTDPPYGVRKDGSVWDSDENLAGREKAWESRAHGSSTSHALAAVAGAYDISLKGRQAFQDWTEGWAREALRVATPGAYILSFCSPRLYHRMAMGIELAGFEPCDVIAWLVNKGIPKNHGALKPRFEPCFVARKPGKGRMNTGMETWPPNVALDEDVAATVPNYYFVARATWKEQRGGTIGTEHATVKPIQLMRWLVQLTSEPGDLVLDPFTGFGSTGIAAALEHRRFVGFDVDERNVVAARSRIADWSFTYGIRP